MANINLYYIGFNSNNAIGNNFAGTITLYPTGEAGNIYFSDKYLENINTEEFYNEYKNFILKNYLEIIDKNENSAFMCFNKKIIDICNSIDGMKIVKTNSSEILDLLNNKNKTRKIFSDDVPVLDYIWFEDKKSYNELCERLDSSAFVLQEERGSGGDTTFIVRNADEFAHFFKDGRLYCASKYLENVPLNVTCIIGDKDILYFQPSAQLIEIIDNRFKYVGGDFSFALKLSSSILDDLKEKSMHILNKVHDLGYRGVIGIDFVLDKDNKLYFMEINPRFQSSTFMINEALKQTGSNTVSHLHYMALSGDRIKNVKIADIDSSFLNCNLFRNYPEFSADCLYSFGYFEPNQSSVYRKVFNKSVIDLGNFERIR